MAANKPISTDDVNQAIDSTIAESDKLRADALAALQKVLCAEAIPLAREQVRLTERFGAADPRVVQVAELLEINKAFTREVVQETVRAEIGVPLVEANAWVVHGFVRDVDGNGLANLTIAPYDSIKPAADWVKELGHVCTDGRGYFKLEASNFKDYSAAPVYLHVLNAAGATLYKDAVPFTPKGGQLNYREFVISGQTLDCPPPPPPAPPSVDLSITKVESPDPVAPDADLTYTLTVTNHTRAEAKDVKVTDTLPAQTTFVSASGGGFTCTHGNGVVNCTLPTLAAEATATIKLVVKVSPDTKHGTVLNNTAAVTATTSDPDTANNTAATTTTVVRAADLSITKTDTPDPVVAGANITYTLAIRNGGPNAAENVKVTDSLPEQTTFISASGGGFTCAHGSGVVTCTLPALAAGATATITIVVKVSPGAKHGTVLNNTAAVTATTSDTDTDNNTATTTTTVVSAADLSITKTVAPNPVVAGESLTCTLQVTNPAGASDAQNVTVTDAVPANTTFLLATAISGEDWKATVPSVGGSGKVVFSKPSLAPGETANLQIVVKVNKDTTAPIISNTATVASSTTDPSAGNNTATATTTVKPLNADLSITKTDAPKKVAPGADITYTLTIGNNGPNAAEEVVITDTLESGLGFVSIEAPDYSVNTPRAGASGTIKCTRPTLAVGQSTRITIVARLRPAAAGGTLPSNVSNTANVSAKTPDLDPTNNTATATTTVKPLSADLSITKTDAPNRVAPGADITYTLTITNNGPNAAENVAVTDAIPADTAFVLSKVTSGEDWITSNPSARESNNVVFAKTTVAAGETASFQIVVRLNKNTTLTRISNTATVTSSTTDPDSANNTIEAITKVQQQTQTRRALVVFTEVNKAGDHTPLQGSTQPLVTFIDNVPNSGDLEAAFKSPPSGFALNQFKGITMASVVDKLDAGIQVRLNAAGSALTKAGGASTLRTSTVVLSAGDQTTLASRKISIADIDEVIFLEL